MFVKVDISSLPLGKRMAQDIYDFDGHLLISKGIVVQESHLQQLRQRGYEYVYIQEEDEVNENSLNQGIAYLTDKDVVRHELVSRIIRAYEEFDEDAWKEGKISAPKGTGEKRTDKE